MGYDICLEFSCVNSNKTDSSMEKTFQEAPPSPDSPFDLSLDSSSSQSSDDQCSDFSELCFWDENEPLGYETTSLTIPWRTHKDKVSLTLPESSWAFHSSEADWTSEEEDFLTAVTSEEPIYHYETESKLPFEEPQYQVNRYSTHKRRSGMANLMNKSEIVNNTLLEGNSGRRVKRARSEEKFEEPYLSLPPASSALSEPLGAVSNKSPSKTTQKNNKATGAKPVKKERSKQQSSKYRGVSRCSKDGRWQARIRVGSTVKYLGRFRTEIEAARRYDLAAYQYHGHRAMPNFTREGLPIQKA